jgi:hypothetical protein
MATDESILRALARRIQTSVNETGRCLFTTAADLAPLKALNPADLQAFAKRHGWTVVPRLGFAQVEFFAVHR